MWQAVNCLGISPPIFTFSFPVLLPNSLGALNVNIDLNHCLKLSPILTQFEEIINIDNIFKLKNTGKLSQNNTPMHNFSLSTLGEELVAQWGNKGGWLEDFPYINLLQNSRTTIMPVTNHSSAF